MILGIETEKKLETLKYFQDTATRLKGQGLFKNPYDADTKIFVKNNDLVFLIKSKVRWFPFYWIGVFITIVSQVFLPWGFNWLAIVGICIMCTYLFYSVALQYWAIRFALRNKIKYKGKIKILSDAKIFEVLWRAN